jgi:hypothetical protein
MKKSLIPVSIRDKVVIKRLFKQGYNANKIRTCVSAYTRQQIAAVMAHCTMGGKNYPY